MEPIKINEIQDGRAKEEMLHHKQLQLCTTRPAYRQGRKFTAVKVYTVSAESQHLFVYGVSSINLRSELKSLFNKYGEIVTIHVVDGQEVELFTECYHVRYKRIQSARIAKRFVDTKSFYGGVLHVCYAPEYETLEETTAKLVQRKNDVMVRLNKYNTALHEKHLGAEMVNEHKQKQICSKRSQHEDDAISTLYSEEDPILSHKKRQKKNAEETIMKYCSQYSDVNGGPSSIMNNSFKKTTKISITLPLTHKTISEDQVYGPQLPKFPENVEKPAEEVPQRSEECSNIFSQKNIRKLPNNTIKRIVFKNKIQDKIS